MIRIYTRVLGPPVIAARSWIFALKSETHTHPLILIRFKKCASNWNFTRFVRSSSRSHLRLIGHFLFTHDHAWRSRFLQNICETSAVNHKVTPLSVCVCACSIQFHTLGNINATSQEITQARRIESASILPSTNISSVFSCNLPMKRAGAIYLISIISFYTNILMHEHTQTDAHRAVIAIHYGLHGG